MPGWLLPIMVSYMTERSMRMRYKGATFSRRMSTGSTTQGALLGILLFIVYFNGALLRPIIHRINTLTLKFIDELSLLTVINLQKSLICDQVLRPRPLASYEMTQQLIKLRTIKCSDY